MSRLALRGAAPRPRLMRPLRSQRHCGFTLVELLVVIAIIAILAAMSLGALMLARGRANVTRTSALIVRLDRVIQVRYESYRTRRMPINQRAAAVARLMSPPTSYTAAEAQYRIYRGREPSSGAAFAAQEYMAATRLITLRELMRLEMPQRYVDITSDLTANPCPAPTTLMHYEPSAMPLAGFAGLPALNYAYRRRIDQNRDAEGMALTPTEDFEAAECLYLVVTMGALEENATPQDLFRADDVGDFDNDGMKEFQDAWGNPIYWIRWPAGFDNRWWDGSPWLTDDTGIEDVREHLVSTTQPDPTLNPMTGAQDAAGPYEFTQTHRDPFDPLGIDGFTRAPYARMASGDPPAGYAIHPLIFSLGPNATLRPPVVDIVMDPADQDTAEELNDPYYRDAQGLMAGTPYDYYFHPVAAQQNGEEGLECLDNIHNQQPREQ